ncbi:hypothetical protein ASF70_18770 [Rhizobium sp. Leaf321]|uniref:hypothetical protein n=1 Tax=Rhizobium sp. Leaf321 TaxID=1736335 RepID=UPI0007127492|nr:hypothetical protein [Rhizobium sp. Leaf321]KQQ70892.1 hypothetical protein ASF70_18770 [Rhizobium sp. Leaf321]
MDKQSNSTPAFKSLGELTENIVDGLAARKEVARTIGDLIKAEAIVHTVWLALSSPSFDGDDANAVLNTLSEAWETLKGVRSQVEAFNDAELRLELARRTA